MYMSGEKYTYKAFNIKTKYEFHINVIRKRSILCPVLFIQSPMLYRK